MNATWSCFCRWVLVFHAENIHRATLCWWPTNFFRESKVVIAEACRFWSYKRRICICKTEIRPFIIPRHSIRKTKHAFLFRFRNQKLANPDFVGCRCFEKALFAKQKVIPRAATFERQRMPPCLEISLIRNAAAYSRWVCVYLFRFLSFRILLFSHSALWKE